MALRIVSSPIIRTHSDVDVKRGYRPSARKIKVGKLVGWGSSYMYVCPKCRTIDGYVPPTTTDMLVVMVA